MMGIEAISDFFELGKVLNSSIKFFGILGSIVYFVFTVVTIRQIRIMKETVLVKDGGLLLLLGYVQIGVAILLISYSIFL